MPHFPIVLLELGYTARNRSIKRDQLAKCDSARERQLRVHELVREHYMITTSRIAHFNKTLLKIFKYLMHKIGDWVWVYNAKATVRQVRANV